MLNKIDARIMGWFDAGAAYLQKRGILLTRLHVIAAGMAFIASVGSAVSWSVPSLGTTVFLTVINGLVWGGWLFVNLQWANENHDYPSSVRMVERLNSEALRHRETQFAARFVWVFFILVFVPVDVMLIFTHSNISRGIFGVIFDFSPLCMWYLNGCFFLGPGEFSKQKKEFGSFNALPQKGN